jgi:serine/threonine-protein kinase
MTADAVPQQVGPYEILRPIASGGMGTVYLGRLVRSGGFERAVAIKVMHPHLAGTPEFVGMFLDEARLAAGIHHPNVVPTLDIEHANGRVFLIMEYVDGCSLGELVGHLADRGQTLPLSVILRISQDVLAGLHAAHDLTGPNGGHLGLVHRDVCPANILVGKDGIARLSDFGVARAASRITSTRTDRVKGKLPYMAPEQFCGERIDRRTDLFSFGAVLWEMLTGQRFRVPSNAHMIAAVLTGPRARPREILNVPPLVDEVCMRALAAPAERFQTALEFSDALTEAAAEAGAAAATPHIVAELVRGARLAAATQAQQAARSDAPTVAVVEDEGDGPTVRLQATDLHAALGGDERTVRHIPAGFGLTPAAHSKTPHGLAVSTTPAPNPPPKTEPDQKRRVKLDLRRGSVVAVTVLTFGMVGAAAYRASLTQAEQKPALAWSAQPVDPRAPMTITSSPSDTQASAAGRTGGEPAATTGENPSHAKPKLAEAEPAERAQGNPAATRAAATQLAAKPATAGPTPKTTAPRTPAPKIAGPATSAPRSAALPRARATATPAVPSARATAAPAAPAPRPPAPRPAAPTSPEYRPDGL